MVQVLPYVQSPLEQLNPYIQQASSQIGAGLQNRAINKRTQSILSQLQNPELSQIQQATLASQLPKENADQYLAARKIQAYENASAQRNQAMQQAAAQKQQQEALAQEQEIASNRALSENIRKNLKYSGPWGKGFIRGTDQFAGREELDSAGIVYADKSWSSINKGTMTDAKQKLIMSKLAPNSNLTPEQNEARVNILDDMNKVTRNLSPEKAEKYIDKKVSQIDELDKKSNKLGSFAYEIGQEFERMPSASKAGAGTVGEDSSGNVYVSDGKRWIKRGK